MLGTRKPSSILSFAALAAALPLLACGKDHVLAPATSTVATSVIMFGAIVDSAAATQGAAAVAHFDLTVTAFGAHSASDTSGAIPMPGTTVALTRIKTAAGDTVTTDADVGTAVADTNGRVRFSAVATGYFYLLRATPPASSTYQPAGFMFGSCACQESPALIGEIWMPHQ
jgi:hypothetical protein